MRNCGCGCADTCCRHPVNRVTSVYFREIDDVTSISRELDESAARHIPSKHRINQAVWIQMME